MKSLFQIGPKEKQNGENERKIFMLFGLLNYIKVNNFDRKKKKQMLSVFMHIKANIKRIDSVFHFVTKTT